MYILGMFVGEQFPEGEERDDLDFFTFPALDDEIGSGALDAPIDGYMMTADPADEAAAKEFLTFLGSAEAGETLQKATDLTNELLTANAETLRSSTQAIRTQVERGIVDIAAVKQANDALIATIDDALRIADEGKRQRVEAEKQLVACETELKQAIIAARTRTSYKAQGTSHKAQGT